MALINTLHGQDERLKCAFISMHILWRCAIFAHLWNTWANIAYT